LMLWVGFNLFSDNGKFGSVLVVRFFIKCWCYGWSYCQWSNCRIYWKERGRVLDLFFISLSLIV